MVVRPPIKDAVLLCVINKEYVVQAHEATPSWKRELQPIGTMIDSSLSSRGGLPVLDGRERRNLGAFWWAVSVSREGPSAGSSEGGQSA